MVAGSIPAGLTSLPPPPARGANMPFVSVKMLPGRSVEQKRQLVKAITEALVSICGATPQGTTVVIEEIAREDWSSGGVLIADRDAPPGAPRTA
ncbi:MAG: 2-hydroxymuconate tautomerase [Candidatus Latescibacterota bacterium]